jgi:hypothetical protein
VRPLLPVAVRKHFQKAWFTNWSKQHFPKWPVDSTVDRLFEQLLRLSLKSQDLKQEPRAFGEFMAESGLKFRVVCADKTLAFVFLNVLARS